MPSSDNPSCYVGGVFLTAVLCVVLFAMLLYFFVAALPLARLNENEDTFMAPLDTWLPPTQRAKDEIDRTRAVRLGDVDLADANIYVAEHLRRAPWVFHNFYTSVHRPVVFLPIDDPSERYRVPYGLLTFVILRHTATRLKTASSREHVARGRHATSLYGYDDALLRSRATYQMQLQRRNDDVATVGGRLESDIYVALEDFQQVQAAYLEQDVHAGTVVPKSSSLDATRVYRCSVILALANQTGWLELYRVVLDVDVKELMANTVSSEQISLRDYYANDTTR